MPWVLLRRWRSALVGEVRGAGVERGMSEEVMSGVVVVVVGVFVGCCCAGGGTRRVDRSQTAARHGRKETWPWLDRQLAAFMERLA